MSREEDTLKRQLDFSDTSSDSDCSWTPPQKHMKVELTKTLTVELSEDSTQDTPPQSLEPTSEETTEYSQQLETTPENPGEPYVPGTHHTTILGKLRLALYSADKTAEETVEHLKQLLPPLQ